MTAVRSSKKKKKTGPLKFPFLGAIHSTKISGNFGPKVNGSVRSNRKSFEKMGPPFEVVLFSRLEFWLNGSRPLSLKFRIQFRAFGNVFIYLLI